MLNRLVPALLASLIVGGTAAAGPLALTPATHQMPDRAVQPVAAPGPNLGGGFIEMLFGGSPRAQPQPSSLGGYDPSQYYQPSDAGTPQGLDPRYLKQEVDYAGSEAPGTIIINTPERFLYLVEGNGRALRYGIGVGRPGFTWAGVHNVTSKREWPDWTPPEDMLKRRPDLPRHMEGGPENPLGARALYLGSTLYRIHGSNEPWTIGTAVSSGCIRMRNEDVIDLYDRVKVGAKVIVI
ncbi:MAG TPA: L,D-transpeptidase [Xanthobacteraceae bacterium]|jgi:lipoprotein-anchoring transpeptidase ErfK/SrfK|nr:L,D-transpeptidase [Xanthobacteraceae bacterium]